MCSALDRASSSRVTSGCGRVCAGLLVFFLGWAPGDHSRAEDVKPLRVLYHISTYAGSQRQAYELELIEACLEITKDQFGNYELVVSTKNTFSVLRTRNMILKGDEINILASAFGGNAPTDGLLRVPIPLFQGLLGYRAFLARSGNELSAGEIDDLRDLKALSVGQVEQWTDIDVYKHNGIVVKTAPDLNSLFSMLSYGRFDILPLGITEVRSELVLRKNKLQNIVLDEQVLIHYPWPFFFYVNPSEKLLAERMEVGLRRLVESKHLTKMLKEHYSEQVKMLNLSSRKLIRLENPYFKDDPLLLNESLWLKPEDLSD